MAKKQIFNIITKESDISGPTKLLIDRFKIIEMYIANLPKKEKWLNHFLIYEIIKDSGHLIITK